jgi:hypothetical protein
MLALNVLLAAYLNAEMELTCNGRRIVKTKMEEKVWNLQVRIGTWNVLEIYRIMMFVFIGFVF